MDARRALLAVAVASAVAYVHGRVFRPRLLNWGSTEEERHRSMPGDETVERPDFDATRGITINANPENIWPWLVQIGFGRAGWYSYDWLDNLGRPSAERIIPELQHLKVGDRIPMSRWNYFTVQAFEPNQWMLWRAPGKQGWTWAWGLYPMGEGRTRLVARIRGRHPWRSPMIIPSLLLMEVGDPFMAPRELQGIRRRAEALALNGT